MMGKLKNILDGLGNVMDVFPPPDYGRYIPAQTAEERMRAHWARTGKHLEKSMDRFSYEQQEAKAQGQARRTG